MTYYISGDTITTEISTIQFFPKEYFNTYISEFTKNNNLIYSIKNNKNLIYSIKKKKISPLIFITKIEYLIIFIIKF